MCRCCPTSRLGRVDDKGKVYEIKGDLEAYIGWIDYEAGEVYDEEDELMGWIEDDGVIIATYEDEEEELGYVTEEGEVFGYDENDEDLYLGKVVEMQDATEGAAAMLLFYHIIEEEQE